MSMETVSSICAYCSNAKFEPWTHLPWHEFPNGKRNGCIYCTVFCAIESHLGIVPGILGARGLSPDQENEFRIYEFYRRGRDWRFFVENNHPSPWPGFPRRDRCPDFDPASEASFGFLQRNLTACAKDHPGCRNTNTFVPKRLVHVAYDDGGAGIFRIVELSAGRGSKYIALSYCWGMNQLLKLTTDTQPQLHAGMPTDDLPVLFRDVLALAKRLEIEYLWIDALCILQDSESDWYHQSRAMPDVYQHAYLTIATSSSSAVNQSIFNRSGQSSEMKALRIPVRDDAGNLITEIVGVPSLIKSRHFWPNVVDYADQADPLELRGWCLQERLLSTRMISFGGGELEWKCCTTSTCECEGDVSDQYNITALSITAQEEALLFWYKRVTEYSKRFLTFPSDKLPAMEGLAIAVAAHTQSRRYLSGLWENDLLRGLCWQTSTPPAGHIQHGPPTSFPPGSRAPSWTWASMDGQIAYFHDVVSPSFIDGSELPNTVLESYRVEDEGGNPNRLLLRGALIPVKLLVDENIGRRVIRPAPPRKYSLQTQQEWFFLNDGMLETTPIVSVGEAGYGITVKRSHEVYDSAELNNRIRLQKPSAFAVPVAFYRDYLQVQPWGRKYITLILTPSTHVPGCYERVGVGTFTVFSHWTVGEDEELELPWMDEDYTDIVVV